MANVVKHRFASAKSDGPDATQIQPSNWNDGHVFSGGNAGDILTRDPTDATYGAKWAPQAIGVWTAVPFNAANFLFSGGPWAVASSDIYANHYTMIGSQTMIWSLLLITSTLSGSPGANLGLIVPAGKSLVIHNPTRVARCVNNSTILEVCIAYGEPHAIYLQRIDGGNFGLGSIRVDFTVTLFVQ